MHTKTGTYCATLKNSAQNRSYVAEYTQAVTNTWEKATITIPVDTTGTWLYDTGVGLFVIFTVACASTYQTSANTWTAGNYFATANQVNALDSTANNFKIALIQLEAGQVATTFETLDVGTVLQRCQRYYERSTALSGINTSRVLIAFGTSGAQGFYFTVPKRATPVVTIYSRNGNAGKVSDIASGSDSAGTITAANISKDGIHYLSENAAGLTVGHGYEANYEASAEL